MINVMQQLLTQFAATCGPGKPFFGLPTWYQYIDASKFDTTGGGCSINFVFPDDFVPVALGIVDILLRVAALVAIAFVVVGGIKYTTSQGEPQEAANARQTIIGALVGLAVATVASALVSFIGNKFGT